MGEMWSKMCEQGRDRRDHLEWQPPATPAPTSVRVSEHPEVQPSLGMSDKELAALQLATQAGGQRLAAALAAVNRTCWDCIGGTRECG